MSSEEDEVALVKCGTTKGPFTIKFIRKWSPHGYDRAVELFERGFYDHTHFFRVLPNFLVQFGITYTDDKDLRKFARNTIPDDPKIPELRQFRPGLVSYAGSGENSRDTQLFISYGSAKSLGTMPWETPLGEVIEGMANVQSFNSEYKESPQQGKIHTGPKYIEENFPNLDKFESCTIERTKAGEEDKQEESAPEKDEAEKPNAVPEEKPAPLEEKKEIKEIMEGKSEKLQAASSRLGSTTVGAQSTGGNAPIIVGTVVLLGFVFFVKKKVSGRGRTKNC